MAIKASTQITISKVIDVYAVYRYYKLQSSTLAKPSKPTANPPSGWSNTEPAYVSGSTNTLYFVDCNVYSDKSFSFSEVSKSSSYEAAKDAWNKANNAQNTANSAKDFTDKAKNQYGYQYKYDITLNGDANKYYPVVILGGNQNVMREIMVTRGYSEKCPTDWDGHPTTKGIALLLKLKCNFGGWGGATYSWWIHDLTEQYGNVFASAENCMANMGFAIFLRGGGETGAIYHLYSDQALETTRYTGSGPKAYYNSDRIAWTGGTSDNPTYSWNAPDPRTLTDAVKKQIASKKYIQMAADAISDVDVEYYLSTSATSLSGGSWSTTAPTWVNGKYMWSRTVTTDGAGNKTYSPSQNGVCIAGAKGATGAQGPKGDKGNPGATGATGATGNGVKSIVEQYYQSTSATLLAGGSWSTTYPGWVNGKYIWTRSVITYTSGSTDTTTPICVTGQKGDTGAKGDKGATGATGPQGPQGAQGPKGDKGKDAAIISKTEPSDKTYLWCDTSVNPPVLKQWNGEEWVIVNDNAEQITQIYKEITNSITQSSENIMMQVGEKTYTKEAVDRLLSDMNTSFEQTKNSFNFEFNQFQTALNDLSNSTDTKFENTSKYIRFVNGEIYIGVEGNPIMLRLRNDRLSFLENNAEVAYISNRTLYFTHAEVLKDLKIGRFAWVAMDSGYMALKLVE